MKVYLEEHGKKPGTRANKRDPLLLALFDWMRAVELGHKENVAKLKKAAMRRLNGVKSS